MGKVRKWNKHLSYRCDLHELLQFCWKIFKSFSSSPKPLHIKLLADDFQLRTHSNWYFRSPTYHFLTKAHCRSNHFMACCDDLSPLQGVFCDRSQPPDKSSRWCFVFPAHWKSICYECWARSCRERMGEVRKTKLTSVPGTRELTLFPMFGK